MILQIHRNPENNELVLQIAVNRVKTYITLVRNVDHAAQIERAVELMGGDSLAAIEGLITLLRQMRLLTQETRRKVNGVKNVSILDYEDANTEETRRIDKFFQLDALLQNGNILTHAEIYWLDWFIRKHKLLGGENESA